MSDLVGIIRREDEIKTALAELEQLHERAAKVSAPGGSAYNPGWHLALDLRNILLIAQCVAQAALERQESRGGHTRDDYPGMSPEWRKVNLICSLNAAGVTLRQQPMEPMRTDLLELFDIAELKKYMTEEELAGRLVRLRPPRRRHRLPLRPLARLLASCRRRARRRRQAKRPRGRQGNRAMSYKAALTTT